MASVEVNAGKIALPDNTYTRGSLQTQSSVTDDAAVVGSSSPRLHRTTPADDAARPQTAPLRHFPGFKTKWKFPAGRDRDSGLATISSTISTSSFVPGDDGYARQSKITSSHDSYTSLPALINEDNISPTSGVFGQLDGSAGGRVYRAYEPRLSTDIPSAKLFGHEYLDQMSFSKRGSVLVGGRRAVDKLKRHSKLNSIASATDIATTIQSEPEQLRSLSADEAMLSQQVRSLYEQQESSGATLRDQRSHYSGAQYLHPPPLRGANGRTFSAPSPNTRNSQVSTESGSVEDWEDMEGQDVDRYGFIVPRKLISGGSSPISGQPSLCQEPSRPQRVSTVLQMASEAPRRKRAFGRLPSSRRSSRSLTPQTTRTDVSGSGSQRPHSAKSAQSGRSWAFHLPGNKDRRVVNGAADMLTLPPGLANIKENDEWKMPLQDLRRKESERAEKWRKMARVVSKRANGGGMMFDFDVNDPKLVARTWKGIPDRWRATAWHAFLSHSAQKSKHNQSDEEIVTKFHALLEQNSPDDVQIDIDVPRTITHHIMFRKRYRGGQRLLFRLLHSLSLYFPTTGYVQGMASLAATLLCYYDEDTAFVMLVRLWQLRGLERLYQPGFSGLMETLTEFEGRWLANSDVARHLTDLGIDATAYGTRWYLTLFNYSVPFPAQLRIWDVFMLLGDHSTTGTTAAITAAAAAANANANTPPTLRDGDGGGGFDILHAAAAALIDGMRDILLESDFENAMKVLTSWIPIRDEDLFMRVARAEWKQRRKR